MDAGAGQSGTASSSAPLPSQLAFISYSREQFYWAESLALTLRQKDVAVWLDAHRLLPGMDWEGGIQQALQSSSAVLLVGSPAAFRSEYVEREWSAALAEGKRVVVALVETAELPAELLDPAVSLVDCRSDFDRGVEHLVECLRDGVVHRDRWLGADLLARDTAVPRFLQLLPRDVAVVALFLLSYGLYALAVALLLVGAFGFSMAAGGAALLLALSIYALFQLRSFLRHHLQWPELLLTPIVTAVAAAVVPSIVWQRPIFHKTLGNVDELPMTQPWHPGMWELLLLSAGIAFAVLALYPAWLLLRSGDIYRWTATGEAFFRRRYLKAFRSPRRQVERPLAHPRHYHLHYTDADRSVAMRMDEVIYQWRDRSGLWQPAVGDTAPRESPAEPPELVHVAILSNTSPVAWLRELAAEHERLIVVVASAIAVPLDLGSLDRRQWVDFRGRRDEQLAPLCAYLWGAPPGEDIVDVVPEALSRPVWPLSLSILARLALVMAGIVAGVAMRDAATLLASTYPSASLTWRNPWFMGAVLIALPLQVWAVGVAHQRQATREGVAWTMMLSLAPLLAILPWLKHVRERELENRGGTYWTLTVHSDTTQLFVRQKIEAITQMSLAILVLAAVILVLAAVSILFAAMCRRWLPDATEARSDGPTLAVPSSWPIWSGNLFWFALPLWVTLPLLAAVPMTAR